MLVEQGTKCIFISIDLLINISVVVTSIVWQRFVDITSKSLQIDITSLAIANS